jgi:FkbM family methyltransferase
LKRNGEELYYDFKGAKIPAIPKNKISKHRYYAIPYLLDETFLMSCFFNDNYDKNMVEYIDNIIGVSVYGYTDGDFDVTVKKGDIVIDAGAWIGDFSAYAVTKGATAYAFEPASENYCILCETEKLNNVNGGGQIYSIQKGLGCCECEIDMSIVGCGAENSIITKGNISEKISVTTLDKFVEENKLERIDFIKSDIEGAERDMLKGASNVLKTFAPKLAICTYHLPDDPEVLEKIIKEANPNYTVVHLKDKLFAAVVNE